MHQNRIYTIVYTFVCIFFTFNCFVAEASEHIFSVKYIAKYTTDNQFKDKENFIKKISNYIFGEEEIHLIKPMNMVKYNENILFVLDQGRKSIIQIDSANSSYKIIENANRQFPSLVGICLFDNEDVLFTDSALNQIFKYSHSSSTIIEFKTSIELKKPTGIAYIKSKKEIWVCETAGHHISVFNDQGNLLKTIGKRGAEPGEFNFPNFVWFDEKGFVYIIDSMNYRVQILNTNGEVLSIFGKQGDASGFMAAPKGIATDSFGHIYVADALFHTVQVFDKEGKYLYNFGSQGKNDGEFILPAGLFIDDTDKIYVADSYNSRVQVFQLIHGAVNE